MVGKRHASGEISAKLAQANELAAKGKTQREISKALGVSIMTYHRWKKMLKSSPADNGVRALDSRPQSGANDASSDETIKRLELENAQLRRLVTDMLLEKLKYEEELRSRHSPRMRRPDNG
ncbi:Homeodomain-like domain-containing protein [Bradyrhizobium sp. R2.2-H]|jgi:transposase|uniref:helix-turn-helix domain-containing protein n=1 Tax=unclassified Bradyrhizobium TaxID=2631580 RepID=UPI001047C13D|nr:MULTISPECIES: helix-turn-helix domain-containing protein [unclassified Bradyrhizobium]TCU76723.1 Homeodomain-like domain-containing protein [Bradyrhizobium sp. Y-H1]TCU79796.1 Homeodomain-like domain-containing protein [Bradyrhizobium sp. R2.2-H]